MSATRGAAARDPLDRYYTPAAWADAVIAPWASSLGRLACVVEPSVGTGVWALALRRAGYAGRIVGVDLDPDARAEGCDEVVRGDWCEVGPAVLERERPGLVLGNPPYNALDAHLDVMLRSPASVSLTVRTCWLQSARVQAVLELRPPSRVALAIGRLAFGTPEVPDRKTSDSTDYCQVTWGKGTADRSVVEWVRWKAPASGEAP